jgi:hypothetical protein
MNDGYVEDNPGVDFHTQTEEDLFEMAAKGQIISVSAGTAENGGAEKHAEAEGASDVVAASSPVSPSSPKLHRRTSVRIMTPRRRAEHGGYAMLNETGEDDLELRSRGAGTQIGGEAANPMWEGAEEGQVSEPQSPSALLANLFKSSNK